MTYMRVLIFFLFLSLFGPSVGNTTPESPSQVWRVGDRRWTVEEEIRYGKWVEENLTEDFFIRYKIPIDCADVPYAVRWIYARMAKLPAAAHTKNNRLIGHWSKDWGNLPTHKEWHKDQRFRRALLYMLSETTTRTLPLDTYPIRIDAESVTPGTPFFITESHSGIVARIITDGSHVHPVQTWESTYPAKIQKLNQRNFLSTRPESTTYSGLVKFRWPIFENGEWRYLPPKKHPFYSEEQYSSHFYEGSIDYAEAVARRIDPSQYDPQERLEKLLETIANYLRERIPIVLAGYRRCQRGGCREGSELWEIYSTPGRDGFIILLMDYLQQFVELNQLDKERLKERMEAIYLPISRDRLVTLYHIYQNYLWLSPHPEDSIEARWGLKKCEMILSKIRTTESSIRFIERTYRRRDPKYADFAISQQREILKRLTQAWENSQCEEIGGRSIQRVKGKK